MVAQPQHYAQQGASEADHARAWKEYYANLAARCAKEEEDRRRGLPPPVAGYATPQAAPPAQGGNYGPLRSHGPPAGGHRYQPY